MDEVKKPEQPTSPDVANDEKKSTEQSKAPEAKIDEIKQSLAALQAPTPKPPMTESHSLPIKKLLLTFILLLIIIPGTVLTFSIRQTKQSLQSKVIPTTAMQPTPTTNPTANWQTYKDTEENFAIKYPANWYTNKTENKSLFGVVTNQLGFSPLASTSGTADNPVPNIVTISVKANTNSLALDEIVDIFGCANPNCKKVQSKRITLAALPAKLTDVSDPQSGKQAVVLKNNKVYTITVLFDSNFAKDYSKMQKEQIFTQMLSTFTFLDKLPTVPTADWKTYTNSAGKYAIKYPDNATAAEQKEENTQFPDAVKDYKGVLFTLGGSQPQSTIAVTVSKVPADMTLQAAIDKGYVPFTIDKGQDTQETSIAGLSGFYTVATTPKYISNAFVMKGNLLYAFHLETATPGQHDSEQLIFNTMLSTFDFTIFPAINPIVSVPNALPTIPNPLKK